MRNFFNLFATPRITIIKVPNDGFVDALNRGVVWAWIDARMGYIWILVALAFLFAELGAPGLFFFVSFAVGALAAGVMAFLGYMFFAQCAIALSVTMLSFWALRNLLKARRLSDVQYEHPDTNIDALVGKQGIVMSAIDQSKIGLVKVGGETWAASSEQELSVGTRVSVLRVEGNRVIVREHVIPEKEQS